MKPLIGITTYYVASREIGKDTVRGLAGQDMSMSTMDYSRSVLEAGGIPVTIPVINDENYIKELATKLDGLLFAGGPDISPLRYGKNLSRGLGMVIPERDEFEFSLMKASLEKNKAIFGICRGFQLINVYFGGTLHQDAWSSGYQQIEHRATIVPKTYPVHPVTIKKESLLYQAYGKESFMVNSYHHQIIDELAPGLDKLAWSEDGVIEGIQHHGYDFVLGVQWHPEMMVELHPDQLAVFKLFVDRVKRGFN